VSAGRDPAVSFAGFRFRRLRDQPMLRELLRETRLHPADFVLPLFVEEGQGRPHELPGLPGVVRHSEASLPDALGQAWERGVRAVLLFGVSRRRDPQGRDSLDADGLMARMIRAARAARPEMLVISDNCFCEYTDHGHCGVWDGQRLDNDRTLENLGRQVLVAADAGVGMVAPSGMIDGQVAWLRRVLDDGGHAQLPILSYSSKFTSALYGPFRDAVDSHFKGHRLDHQLEPANAREAVAESLEDEAQGADMLMVKPAGMYLDVVAQLRQLSRRPLAVFQVSGEYAMIRAAAAARVAQERELVLESLLACKRAGADLLISYYAMEAIAWLEGSG